MRWRGLLCVGGFLRLGLHARDGDDAHDIMCAAAARQVVDRGGDALGHRAERLGVRQALHQLVADVARIKVGEDQAVRLAGNLAVGGLRSAHGRHHGGIGLQLAVERQLGC